MKKIILSLIAAVAINSHAQMNGSNNDIPPGYENFQPQVSGQTVPWDKSKVFIFFFDRFYIASRKESIQFLESYLSYLKNLKTCTRSNHLVINAFADVTEEFKINGWKGEHCRVKYIAHTSEGECRIHKEDIPALLEKRKNLTKFMGFEGLSRDEDAIYLKSCRYKSTNSEGGNSE